MASEKPQAIFEVKRRRRPTDPVGKATLAHLTDVWVPSRFNVSVDLTEDRKAVYNTFSGAMAFLPREAWGQYFSPRAEFPVTAGSLPDALEDLHSKGLLVSKGVDEIVQIRRYYERKRYAGDVLGVNLVPTLACNLRCPYCFEGRAQENHPTRIMTRKTQDAVVRYVLKTARGKKEVYLVWFGGEPLLAVGAIERISSRLVPALKGLGVSYRAVMVTNATLLSPEVVARLRRCQVKWLQVTVDVPKGTKRDGQGRDTLDRVLDNICGAADAFQIHLRINLTRDDEAEFDQLYDKLIERGLDRGLASINIAKVFQPECGRTSCATERPAPEEYVEVLHRERAKAGAHGVPMKAYLPKTRTGGCAATNPLSFTISPDGLLYKCVSDLGMPQRAYGSVFNDFERPENLVPWLTYDWFQHEMCRDCSVLPQCLGGCPHRRRFQAETLGKEDFCYWHFRGDLESRIREDALARLRSRHPHVNEKERQKTADR